MHTMSAFTHHELEDVDLTSLVALAARSRVRLRLP
jgi:hypothetical protein